MNRFDRDFAADQDELPLRQSSATLPNARDREYTLSSGIVLSIFFALALICAIFFGFGYTLGRKSMQPATTETASTESTSTSSFSKFKPAAGSTSGGGSTAAATSAAPSASEHTTTSAPDRTASSSVAVSTAAPAPRAEAPPARVETPAPVVRQAPSPAPVNITPAVVVGGSTMVQIAAVSHPEDAEVLTAALRRRGYTVVARQDGGDRLIHVQVGPFGNRKDAEAMRQKLLGDGYNAILK